MAEPARLREEIESLINAASVGVDRLEQTLTDGYAHALGLEAQKSRLEKRRDAVALGLEHADPAEQARELTALTKSLDRNAIELRELRQLLSHLRRRGLRT